MGDDFVNDNEGSLRPAQGKLGSLTNENCRRLLDSRVEGVLLTHAHFDHIYGLPLLLEKFPEVAIYTNEWGKAASGTGDGSPIRFHSPSSVCL